MANKILQAENLHKSYPMGQTRLHVLRGISLAVEPGEFVAIMGASGSGKSTLLHILGALDLPDKGRVLFNGNDILARGSRARDRYRNESFGFVFQFYHLLPEFNILENILLPRMVAASVFSWWSQRRQAVQSARQVLDTLGLTDRIKHRPAELSGGEQQRVAIARALVNHPNILLADEPTGNLDKKTGREILTVLKRLNTKGQTVIMVTHDPEVAQQAHRIVHLADGRIQKKNPDHDPEGTTPSPKTINVPATKK